jgi:hypothetical protein
MASGYDMERGGGIYVQPAATLDLRDCVITGNRVERPEHSGFGPVGGGGIYNAGSLHITRCSFRRNDAGGRNFDSRVDGNGGALFNAATGVALIEDSTFSENSASGSTTGSFFTAGSGYGGAICNAGSLTIRNCTLSGNLAVGGNSPFAMSGAAQGGAIHNSGSLILESSTIAMNTARTWGEGQDAVADGGGLHQGALGSTQLHATLLALNLREITCAPPQCNLEAVFDDCAGFLTSNGYNLIGTDKGCSGAVEGVSGDRVGGSGELSIDPLLGPLADNGGPTQTHELLPSSQAIDSGDPNDCPATDQRGAMRPRDGDGNMVAVCDIGAFESAICTGSCDGNGEVTVEELVTLVNVALGESSLTACVSGDRDGDLRITIDEIVAALTKALEGCGGFATP